LVSGWWQNGLEIGLAEGIYGGWATLSGIAWTLPLLRATAFLAVGHNWRFAIALTGMVAAVYVVFLASKTRLLAKFTSDPPAAKGWK